MAVAISRRGEVEPFHAMDILAEANRLRALGAPVISMAVGQPSDPAPQRVRDAAAAALKLGRIGYTDALGLADLRKAISAHYADHYRIDVPVSRIAVTTGSSAAFNLAFLAMFDAGDRVAIAAPGYPAYRNIMGALGLDVVEIELEGAAYLHAEHLRTAHAQKPLKGVLFASPANPTGAVVPAGDLKALVDTARELGIAVISDEIYHRLAYGAPDVTALTYDSDVTVINSFSKYYCMTGWRIGWMVLPDRLVRPVERIAQSLYISAPELSQVAAIEAFNVTDELEVIKARYAWNRELLAKRLPELGFSFAAPMDGAFYAFCDVSRLTNDSMEFASRMLAEAHVAATPGRDFDPLAGHRFMRFSYAGSHDDMIESMDRLERWLR
ncbi:aminotransferase class I/II-fold pyridoxal phosphate-dependent enzyme [Aminobacter sp. NyZ550]|jgi:aspartate/methionine/tyrosine aminotransferase|uniref:aspartate transaminase n=1 Tax=Aminobacter aminovorans TaxID=83263 RepID=A0AAC8YQ60_AMIAI|nr:MULTISPECIES: aminotransferase class I/II-fold pyridoxal phosphate-dependent enzyme [Aminobacter]AMS42233.1 1-aminocyclopropane-1-carboxylate deaminase [Aminobacter aminovorans]MBB3709612.1 aspartate/methionine/tyrosine aminotransferase [Aminobacter aminovorans]WAX93144.1 aminotransferase class I/II-fold pyridoxal phosphate-dependent enzyme [Aminobacter sp. NyZ550]